MLLLDLSQSKYAYSTSTKEMGSEYISKIGVRVHFSDLASLGG